MAAYHASIVELIVQRLHISHQSTCMLLYGPIYSICALQSSNRLEKERTRLMCLAKMQFDDNDIMHLRLLQSVYLDFVGGPGPVGRSAAHGSQSYNTTVQTRQPAMTSPSHITPSWTQMYTCRVFCNLGNTMTNMINNRKPRSPVALARLSCAEHVIVLNQFTFVGACRNSSKFRRAHCTEGDVKLGRIVFPAYAFHRGSRYETIFFSD